MASQEKNESVVARSEKMPQTAGEGPIRAEAYHPGFFERQLNVAKEVGQGAYDRLKDDVINFADHPLRSTAEIAGTAVIGGALVAGAVEAGAATAVYAGLTTLSTEIGALYGATAATAMVAPAAERALNKGTTDWCETSGARQVVADPGNHNDAELKQAKTQIRQTLGSDVGGAVETAGMIAAGAVVSRAIGSLVERNTVQTTSVGTVGGEHNLSGGITERALATSENTGTSQVQYTHVSSGDSLLPRDVAAGNSFKPEGLWFSESNAWSKTMSTEMPELRNGHAFQINLDNARILYIRERADLDGLIGKYGIPPEPGTIDKLMKSSSIPRESVVRIRTDIDWNKVAENWDGISFSNVNGYTMWNKASGPLLQDDRPQWFRGLDIDSGVVWNASKVKVQPGTD